MDEAGLRLQGISVVRKHPRWLIANQDGHVLLAVFSLFLCLSVCPEPGEGQSLSSSMCAVPALSLFRPGLGMRNVPVMYRA